MCGQSCFFVCCVFTLPTLTINVSWSIITYISFITNVWSQRSKGFVSKTLEILRLWDVTELKAVEYDSIHESKNVLNNGCYFPDNNVSNAAWRKSSSTNWLIQTELASFFYIYILDVSWNLKTRLNFCSSGLLKMQASKTMRRLQMRIKDITTVFTMSQAGAFTNKRGIDELIEPNVKISDY